MLTNILNNIIKIIFFLFSAFLIVGYTLAILFADRDICDAKVDIHMYDKEHNPIRNCIFLLENTSYKGGTTEYRVKTNSKGYFKIFFEKSAIISIYSSNENKEGNIHLYTQEITQKNTNCTIFYNEL